MQIKELRRYEKQSGESIVEYKTEKIMVRLIKTYKNAVSFDEILYVLACRKLASHIA